MMNYQPFSRDLVPYGLHPLAIRKSHHHDSMLPPQATAYSTISSRSISPNSSISSRARLSPRFSSSHSSYSPNDTPFLALSSRSNTPSFISSSAVSPPHPLLTAYTTQILTCNSSARLADMPHFLSTVSDFEPVAVHLEIMDERAFELFFRQMQRLEFGIYERVRKGLLERRLRNKIENEWREFENDKGRECEESDWERQSATGRTASGQAKIISRHMMEGALSDVWDGNGDGRGSCTGRRDYDRYEKFAPHETSVDRSPSTTWEQSDCGSDYFEGVKYVGVPGKTNHIGRDQHYERHSQGNRFDESTRSRRSGAGGHHYR